MRRGCRELANRRRRLHSRQIRGVLRRDADAVGGQQRVRRRGSDRHMRAAALDRQPKLPIGGAGRQDRPARLGVVDRRLQIAARLTLIVLPEMARCELEPVEVADDAAAVRIHDQARGLGAAVNETDWLTVCQLTPPVFRTVRLPVPFAPLISGENCRPGPPPRRRVHRVAARSRGG